MATATCKTCGEKFEYTPNPRGGRPPEFDTESCRRISHHVGKLEGLIASHLMAGHGFRGPTGALASGEESKPLSQFDLYSRLFTISQGINPRQRDPRKPPAKPKKK